MTRDGLILTAICLGLLGACRPTADGNEVVTANTDQEASLPVPPVVPKALGRGDLLIAMMRAASAHALGQDDEEAQRGLDGQIFEVRMRYGCPGATQPSDVFGATFDPKARTLRLSATPMLSLADPAIAAVAKGEVEAVEGFWIERPWLLASGCARPSEAAPPPDDGSPSEPAAEPQAPSPTPAPRYFGLAHFFGPEESRTLRRDSRPYEVTKTLAETEAPSTQGYDVILSGRLRRLPDGKVIACATGAGSDRPTCIASATFDRVSVRRGDNDELLAEWGTG